MTRRKLVQGVPVVPDGRNPHQHWVKGGTHRGVPNNVPSLSCIPSFSARWDTLKKGGHLAHSKGVPPQTRPFINILPSWDTWDTGDTYSRWKGQRGADDLA